MSAENILEALTDNIVVDKSKCIFCGHCAEKCVLDNIRINRAPCSGACPLGLNVQGYVQLIARGQEDRARQLIADVLPFAPVICRICDHPCEHACNRRDVDGQAVSINGLKRYLFAGMPDGELCPAAATGKKVAIVGAGPAGMLAAYDLRRAGHDVAVYDAAPKAGGLLRSVLPLWKLPDSVLDGQIAMLEKGGVTFHLGQRIDKAGLEALQAAHDAVILALGAGEGRASGISGEQLPGTLQALDFLTRVRSGQGRELSGNVVIVGGGYVALDCAQAAVRCGAEKVLVVYRRTVDDFKADREDLEKARALVEECGNMGRTVTIKSYNTEPYQTLSVWLQGTLSAIGLDAKVDTMERSAFLDQLINGEVEICPFSWSDISFDFGSAVGIYMNSNCIGMSGNYGRYNNPRADELIALGNSASDVEARKGYYRELIEIYMEDVPSVAMYAVINAIAHSNQLVMEDANIYQMARVHWAQ